MLSWDKTLRMIYKISAKLNTRKDLLRKKKKFWQIKTICNPKNIKRICYNWISTSNKKISLLENMISTKIGLLTKKKQSKFTKSFKKCFIINCHKKILTERCRQPWKTRKPRNRTLYHIWTKLLPKIREKD